MSDSEAAADPTVRSGGGAHGRPRVLSGIQPTADSFHLGNYLGALRHWVSMQETHDCFFFIPDLHSITVAHDPSVLARRTRLAVAQLLAVGIDPHRSTLFVQSHLAEHSQLAWVLGCITGFGEASRMTQFKDKSVKGGSDRASVGLFTYPVLQAADILLYQADAVPVGEDQRQHLELSRDLAQRFNTTFGETFIVPNPHIVRGTAKIADLANPTAKMSKSASSPQGVVDLLDEPKAIAKKFRSAVTDTGREVVFDAENKPGVSNLLTIYSVLSGRSIPELEQAFSGRGYGDLKSELADVVIESLAPIKTRADEYMNDPAQLDAILSDGAAKARTVASKTLAAVYERVGFLPG